MDDGLAIDFTKLSPQWFTLIVGGLVVAAGAFPKIMGPLQQWWESLLASKRRTAELRDDADIKELRRQVQNLADEVHAQARVIAEMRAEMRRRDTALHDHYPWDIRAYQLIVASLGPAAIEPPPPLWPVEPESSLGS